MQHLQVQWTLTGEVRSDQSSLCERERERDVSVEGVRSLFSIFEFGFEVGQEH